MTDKTKTVGDSVMTSGDIQRLYDKLDEQSRIYYERMDKLTGAINELTVEQGKQLTFCRERIRIVDKHDEAINGNGSDGLKKIVTRLGDKLEVVKVAVDKSDKQQSTIKWQRRLVYILVISVAGALSKAMGVIGSDGKETKPPAAVDHPPANHSRVAMD